MTEEAAWVPVLSASSTAPRYLAIVASLESDIMSGRIKSRTRLLPQRDMAKCLGLSVGTIAKAYAEAERRGLISGKVGRGTFLLGNGLDGAMPGLHQKHSIDLSLNVPPQTGEKELITETLSKLLSTKDLGDLLGYLPHQGLFAHREAVATLLQQQGNNVDPERVFLTHGAQHALSLVGTMLARPGEIVLAEALTYSGILALSSHAQFRLHGVGMDEEGAIPAALDEKLTSTGARAVYLMPTLQTPTSRVMSLDRRREIANVISRHDAFLIEDDAYAFLFEKPPIPISALIPERSFYTVGFAKSLAPGLRVGALVVPNAFKDRTLNGLRSTGWMASPIMAEVVARLIRNGGLQKQVSLKRQEAAVRYGTAERILGNYIGKCRTPGFHAWLPLPAGRTVDALISQAARVGIALAPPFALQQPLDPESAGVRLCLGAVRAAADLEWGLLTIRSILESVESISIV